MWSVMQIPTVYRGQRFCGYLFQVPNLDHCIGSSGTKDETVGMELSTGQSNSISVGSCVSDPRNETTGPQVRERPVLKINYLLK